jgi:GT2 family glycosyltransferase
MRKIPVVAAIVNYNMANELRRLLPQVIRQGYDEVIVLDDASTDDSRDVVKNFAGVKLVIGNKNRGAGGNRNRILTAVDYDALIHFLDADVILETSHTAKLVRKVAPDAPFGFVGGLIKDSRGLQMVWNYGTGIGLRSSIAAQIQATLIEPNLSKQPKRAAAWRKRFQKLLAGWPDPLSMPAKQRVYWCAEANLIVRSDIFRSLGGFDERFRETESLELGLRMYQQNLPCYFDPTISVVHTAAQVRKYNRNLVKLKDIIRLHSRFGWLAAIRSDGKPN